MKFEKIIGAIQKLGSAMFVPVLLFSFAGIVVSVCIMLTNPYIVGEALASKDSNFYRVIYVIQEGAWTVFRNIPLLFALGLPIGFAEKSNARAVLVTFVSYMTFNYFIAAILTGWGSFFGVENFTDPIIQGSGIVMIGGVKTLDTNMLGGILVALIVTNIHNKNFDKILPTWLSVFQGAPYVTILSFFILIPLAFLTCFIWPKIQLGISSMQYFMANSGVMGVWIYTFLERILIPTGLHHFIYTPFAFGPAVVPNGITAYWVENLPRFVESTGSLKALFPEGGFALYGNTKVFGCLGIALALYSVTFPENKKRMATLLIPATITSMFAGITEPLEFTFLFIAPVLFFIHSLLAATLAATMYAFGVVGWYSSGLINFITGNWIPLMLNHSGLVLTQITIGIIFTFIWFFVFRFLILKWNIKTPGRELEENSVKLYSKKDLKEKNTMQGIGGYSANDPMLLQASIFLDALGGIDNIDSVSNCATRLRILVKDESKVLDEKIFKDAGAYGLVRMGLNLQIIVGLSVSQVRDRFEALLNIEIK
ncbi:MAG: alpha-glucoside-specific PTS transporter subunit IIBC [Brevinema sp.]